MTLPRPLAAPSDKAESRSLNAPSLAGQKPRGKIKIALLMGGNTRERPVSLDSGTACAAALTAAGFKVTPLDPQDRDWIKSLIQLKPDLVFNALHGPFGEDGQVQGLLEALKIPYTHSGVLASALAMDKMLSKTIFAKAGLHVAADCEVTLDQLRTGDPLPRPYVLKPVDEGSSVGVAIVTPGSNVDLSPFEGYARLMAEAFVPGRELTVSCFDGKAKVVTELIPKQGFYDFDAKYTDGKTDHVLPAQLPGNITEQCLRDSETAYRVLQCRGVARADFRYDCTAPLGQQLTILEINTQPGMTDLSLVPEQAAYLGISFKSLVTQIAEDASCDR